MINEDAKANNFLEKFYQFTYENNIEKILDLIFDAVDDWFCSGKFDIPNDILRSLDFEKIDPTKRVSTLTGLLCITLAGKAKLPSRPEFYLKVEQQFLKTESVERTKRLLVNLG